MTDFKHVPQTITFDAHILLLKSLGDPEIMIGVANAIAVMEQAKQARIANFNAYLATLDWETDRRKISEIRMEIERALGIGA